MEVEEDINVLKMDLLQTTDTSPPSLGRRKKNKKKTNGFSSFGAMLNQS